MLAVCERIASTGLASGLYAWTSMHDLCIAQVPPTYPYEGPYLRISPLPNAEIAFRYIDTKVENDQWHRTVPEDAAVPRLLSFFSQLAWFDPSLLVQGHTSPRLRASPKHL